jgi:pectinesterase
MKSALSIGIMCLMAFGSIAQSSADGYDIVVSQDGKGDFQNVQQAIDAVPDFRQQSTTILIKKGTYKEKLVLPASKVNVVFIGESAEETVLTYDNYADKLNSFGERMGTSGSASFYIFGEGFTAENITFENSAGPVGQAVAVRVDADKVIFRNCRFLGYQDTLYTYGKSSRQYYFNCHIEGTTDFIFGASQAFFDQCTIYSKAGGHYITAASTVEGASYGYVFKDCRLTGDAPQHDVYLGRPWRDFAQTVFINCEMGNHIKPEGWHNWDKKYAEKRSFYGEYKSTGPGGSNAKRVSWSKQLNEAQRNKYSMERVFGDWNPQTSEIVKP